ncbi:MAG: hypothetical protein IT245_00575 [Bacteroidia bacterium]|nr:hypothetical protein [Bacteroidia bacterium]
MKGPALIIWILLGIVGLKAQSNSEQIDTIRVENAVNIFSDNLENLYVVTLTNDIIKYTKDGKKQATANFKVLGNISWIDASNPFEIYVFYRDQNRLLILDNLLNLRGEYDLESIGISQIACIARSYDNQIWLFDMADQKLKKYSKDLKLMTESAPWNTLSFNGSINPSMIKDINTAVFIMNDSCILEFDIFANYNKIKLKDSLSSFNVREGQIIFLKGKSLYTYNPLTFILKRLDIELPSNCLTFSIGKERLFILTDEFVILRPYKE